MKAKQFYYAALGALAILVVAGAAGDYFANTIIRKQTAVLKMRLASNEAIDDQISQLENLKKTYEKLKPIVPQIQAALPKDKQQSEVALQLQQLAEAAGMHIPSATFTVQQTFPSSTSQTVAEDGVLALPINFQMSGTYPQLQTFLRSLENLNRYTGVSSLAITLKEARTQTLDFDISVKVYIKP